MLCPACENESENTQQCTNCGWQFINFIEEATEQQKNEYRSLLQNYRTEFFYNLAQKYFENKQYEEAIQCCFISCEHQWFENPSILLALAYKELGNMEEVLKYLSIAIEINPDNEFVNKLIAEENIQPKEQKEIIKITPKMLEKDMFETSEEQVDRINNLGYVEIGTVLLKDYDADKQKLKFIPTVNKSLEEMISPCRGNIFEISLEQKKAKELYGHKQVPLLATLHMKNEQADYIDIKVDNYSFISEFLKYEQSRNEKLKEKQKREEETKREADLEKQIIETEKEAESIIATNQNKVINVGDSLAWKDSKTTLIWEISNAPNRKLTYSGSKEYVNKLNKNKYAGFDDWRIPCSTELSTIYNNKCLSKNIGENSYYRVIAEVFGDHINVFNVNQKNGAQKFTGANNPMHLRCVRGNLKNSISILDKPSVVSRLIKTKWF